MKLSHLSIIFTLLVTSVFTACAPPQTQDPEPPNFKESTFIASCGSNSAEIRYKITLPADTGNKNLFAIVLNGSPGTIYFSEVAPYAKLFGVVPPETHDYYGEIITKLTQQGYRVLELKYPRNQKNCGHVKDSEGFYSLCCGQGMNAVIQHNAQVYKETTQALGYDPSNPKHRLVGLGWSLGSMQFSTMKYISGLKIDDLALIGNLQGSVFRGCFDPTPGIAYPNAFKKYADAISPSTQGCSNRLALQYDQSLDFDKLPYAHTGRLALFEGRLTSSSSRLSIMQGGNPGQVDLILDARKDAQTRVYGNEIPGSTNACIYDQGSHEILFLSNGKASQDILRFLDPKNPGKFQCQR